MDRREVRSSMSLPAHPSRNSSLYEIEPHDNMSQSTPAWKRQTYHGEQADIDNRHRRLSEVTSPVDRFWRTSQDLLPVTSISPRYQNGGQEDISMERAKTDIYLNNLTRTPRYGLGRHKTYADMLAEMNPEDPFKGEYKPSQKEPQLKDTRDSKELDSVNKPKNITKSPSEPNVSSTGKNEAKSIKSSGKEGKPQTEKQASTAQVNSAKNKKSTQSSVPTESKQSPSKSDPSSDASKLSPSKSVSKSSSDIKANKQASKEKSNPPSTADKQEPSKEGDNKEKLSAKKKLAKPFQSSSLSSRGGQNEVEVKQKSVTSVNKETNSNDKNKVIKKNENKNDTHVVDKKSSKEDKGATNEVLSAKVSRSPRKAKSNEVLTLTEKEKTEIRMSLVNLNATIERKKRAINSVDSNVTGVSEKENVTKPEEAVPIPSSKKKRVIPKLTNVTDKKAPGCFLNPQSVSNHLYCSICGDVFDEPQRAPCGHSFCRKCIINWLKDSKTCPEDRKPIYLKQLHHDFVLEHIIADLMVCCPYRRAGCDHVAPLPQLKAHKDLCKLSPTRRPDYHRESKTLPP